MANVKQESASTATTSAIEELPNDGTGKFTTPPKPAQLTASGVIKLDPWLSPFKESLRHRYKKAQDWIATINETEGGLEKFSRVGGPRKVEWAQTDSQRRAQRDSASTWTPRTTSHTGSGRQMQHRHSLLVNSIFLSLLVDILWRQRTDRW
jgi:hypothetical protein